MFRKILLSAVLIAFFFTNPALAQAPQATGGGTFVSEANCDLCGYCKGQATPSSWSKCRSCLYPGIGEAQPGSNLTLIGLPTPDPGHHYTIVGCLSTNPGEFTSQVSRVFFSIVGGVAFLYLLYGAGIITTSRADPEKLNHGKRIIWGAILGLLFVLFSVFIIRFIATSLGVPEFGSQ